MLEAESTYQADVEQLVKKHRGRLVFLLDGFIHLRSGSDFEPWQRKRRIQKRIMLACIFTFIVLYFIPTIEKNYTTLPNFLPQVVMGILVCFLLLIILFPVVSSLIRRRMLEPKTMAGKALELRAMLDNVQLVPLATNQPPILPEYKLPVAPTRIGLIHLKTDAVIMLIGLTTSIVSLLSTVLPQLSFQQGAGSSRPEFIFSVVYLIVIILFCGGLFLTALVFTRRAHSRAEVVVDTCELRWQWLGPGEKNYASIAWHDVQGFYVFVYKELDRMYFLDGRETTYCWSTNHNSPTDVLNASDRLSSLIVTCTHLPLRDLSMAVAMLLTQRN